MAETRTCRWCQASFEPKAYQIRSGVTVCRSCMNAYQRAYYRGREATTAFLVERDPGKYGVTPGKEKYVSAHLMSGPPTTKTLSLLENVLRQVEVGWTFPTHRPQLSYDRLVALRAQVSRWKGRKR